MKVKVLGLIAIATLLASCGAKDQDSKVKEFSDVQSMHLRADGRYNVICQNGFFEVITAEQLAQNEVCNHPTPPDWNILSVQVRADGLFDVVCLDQSREVATAEQIVQNQTCHGTFTAELNYEIPIYSMNIGLNFMHERGRGTALSRMMGRFELSGTDRMRSCLTVSLRDTSTSTSPTPIRDIVVLPNHNGSFNFSNPYYRFSNLSIDNPCHMRGRFRFSYTLERG